MDLYGIPYRADFHKELNYEQNRAVVEAIKVVFAEFPPTKTKKPGVSSGPL